MNLDSFREDIRMEAKGEGRISNRSEPDLSKTYEH